ncbi:MAG: hypothetical protein ABJ239_10625 [Erythrobacter sp.]
MSDLTFVILATLILSSVQFMLWHRVCLKKWAATLSSIGILLIASPILTFFTFEFRAGISLDELGENGGRFAFTLMIMDAVAIFLASTALLLIAHFFLADRFRSRFGRNEHLAVEFE